MNRRTDGKLRSAINVLEGMLLTEPCTSEILQHCLSQLMSLLNARYGFAYECRKNDNDQLYWDLSSCKECLKGETPKEKRSISTSSILPEELREQFLSGRCSIHNNKTPDITPLPSNHPPVKNYMVVPISDTRKVFSVIYLCNTSAEFTEANITRIRPFTAAATCLFRVAYDSQKVRKDTLQLAPTDRILSPQFKTIADATFNAIILVNEQGRIHYANTSAAQLLRVEQQYLNGLAIHCFLPSGAPQLTERVIHHKTAVTPHANSKAVWRGVGLFRADGTKVLVDLSAVEWHSGPRTIKALILDDISERMQSTADYHSTLQRFQALTNLAPVAILQLNRNWECTYTNNMFCQYSQLNIDEVMGIGWLNGLHQQDAERFLAEFRIQSRYNQSYDSNIRLQSPLGKITWAQVSACALFDERGDADGFIVTFSDITDRLENEKRLQTIAERDQLTGLLNRTFFNDRIEFALNSIERYGSVALMFLDLDDFKHVNDSLGHEAGDELLKQVAKRLEDAVRKVDTIARIGGDEFTLLFTGVKSVHSLSAISDKIVKAFERPFSVVNKRVHTSCSIGIAIASTIETDSKTLLRNADAALYKAKEAGKGQHRFYSTELDEEAKLQLQIRQSLKEFNYRGFRLVFQPQVNGQSGAMTGIEVLTRWVNFDGTEVDPHKFIKVIEESGLIQDFSHWLLHTTFNTVRKWQDAQQFPPHFTVSINLSAKQLKYKDLALEIDAAAKGYGLKANKIVLEITETALIDDPKLAIKTLQTLDAMGYAISVDDFGTGYSSLAYLRDLPLKSVKIDRSFIQGVTQNEGDATIVKAIIDLAKTLKLNVIAEGVEDDKAIAWLKAHNCLCHQGFYYYKPLEQKEIEQEWKKASSLVEN